MYCSESTSAGTERQTCVGRQEMSWLISSGLMPLSQSRLQIVKIAVRLRGREFTNMDYAKDKLHNFVQGLSDAADVEQEMRKQGNQFIVIVKAKKTVDK